MTANRSWSHLLPALAAAALAFVLALVGGGVLPPLDRDESRFAQATTQMLETGDFVSIRFQNEERNKKPVGIHWLQAASVAALSDREDRAIFFYRLPSALAVALAAFCVSVLGRRLFDAPTGALAGFLFASMPLVIGEGVGAKTDAALLAAVAVAATALARIVEATAKGERVGMGAPLLLWTALGVGVLIKGPVAPLVLALTIISLSLATRSARLLRAVRPLTGLALVALMVGPWLAAINHSTDGRFFSEALGRDLIGKIGTAQESHGGPPGYHLALASLLLWPAAALVPAGVAAAWRARRETSSLFLLCWAAPTWIVFELTSTKLPHYVLPLYPALAILAARAATSPEPAPLLRLLGASLYAVCGALFGVAVIALPIAYGGGANAATSALGAGIIACACILAFRFRKDAPAPLARAAVALSAATILCLFLVVAPRLVDLDVSRRLSSMLKTEHLHPLSDGAPPAFLAGYAEPSAIFLLGTSTLVGDGAQAARRLAATPGAAVFVESREAASFDATAAQLGLAPHPLGAVEGVNYSKGRPVKLVLYAPAPRAAER